MDLLFTYLIGELTLTPEYFTYTKAVSSMAGGNLAEPGGETCDHSQAAGIELNY